MITVAADVPAGGLPRRRTEPAQRSDLPQLIELVGSTVPDCSPHTAWNLPWTWQCYRVIRDSENRVVACASLQPLSPGDEQRLELRGVAVDRAWRGMRLARELVVQLLQQERRRVFCLTRKPGLFRRFGFVPAEPWVLERSRQLAECGSAPRIPMCFRPDRGPSNLTAAV